MILNLEKMAAFAVEMGASKLTFIPAIPRGRARAIQGVVPRFSDLSSLRNLVSQMRRDFKLDIRMIDMYEKDYWIVENNGDFVIQRFQEDEDTMLATRLEILEIWAKLH